ncbi:MAG: polysaccharide lyase [Planctomycetota bacterium]
MLGLLLIAAAAPPMFACDFEGPGPIASFDRAHRVDRFSIVQDPADAGNRALRVDVGAGDHYGGSLSVQTARRLPEEPRSLYFSYRLRMGKDWDPAQGGKLPGFGGTYGRAGWGGKPSNGRNGWSARGQFFISRDGLMPIGSYVYHADMVEDGRTYGVGVPWDAALERGRWYTIEQQITLDTIGPEGGRGDARLRAWVDGALVFDRSDLHVRDTDDLRIERVWLNIYHGGKMPAPADMHLLIDDVVVRTERPGPQVPP